jgi:DNA-binding LytR/AlgR family response regulator
MFKCFIIDDESHAIQTLQKYAVDSGLLEVAGTSQNPVEAMKIINQRKNIDITFLDIDMPEISGLDVADIIYNNTAIIFTTGHSGYAVHGFEKNISDFLLKPISYQRFLKSVHKVTDQLKQKKTEDPGSSNYFFVNPGIKGKMIKINVDDVEYIEGLNNFVIIHTPKHNHVIYLTMKEMEGGLQSDVFIRVHKSFIVNIDKVDLIEGNRIMIKENELPIGSSFKEGFLKRVNQNIIKSRR